jgi:hypothetical protein
MHTAVHRGVSVTVLLMLVGLAGVTAVANGDSQPTTSAQAIAWLNAQRADNGSPAGITDEPQWDVGCAHHVAWDRRNPHAANPHIEEPGTPGYSEDGAWAGAHSVLGGSFEPSTRFPWGAANGWEMAPIHLMQMLAPALSISGFSPGCMVTIGGWQRSAPPVPQLFTYPGNESSFIYPAEEARESPFTPAAFVGLKEGTITGPYLYVLGWGTGVGPGTITGASLTGPEGPVAIATVDNSTSGPSGDLGSYLPPGGMIIPVHRLAGGATYTATATFAPNEGAGPPISECESSAGSTTCRTAEPPPASPLTASWQFTTALNKNTLEIAGEVLAQGGVGSTSSTFASINVTASLPVTSVVLSGPHGQRKTLSVRHHHAYGSGLSALTSSQTQVRLRSRPWTVCASSGGGTSGYESLTRCATIGKRIR